MYELLSVTNSSNIGKEHARAAEWALAASWLVKALVLNCFSYWHTMKMKETFHRKQLFCISENL